MNAKHLEKIKEFCEILRKAEADGVKQVRYTYGDISQKKACALGCLGTGMDVEKFFGFEYTTAMANPSSEHHEMMRMADEIVHMNDSEEKTFSEIADYLEKKYLFPVAPE